MMLDHTLKPLSPQTIQTKGDILVVDDTPQNLKLLSSLLTQAGYTARCVISGSAALMGIEAEAPDLILLDINMPKMDGYEVCQRIKANPDTHRIPIIFVSALGEVIDKVKAFKVGGVDYITKPFQFEEVLVRLETHLTLQRLQAELAEKNARLEAELARAGQIQAELLPSERPFVEHFDIEGFCYPARNVGGDFYDWIQINPQHLKLTVGDVMGKGMAAALLMATTRATFRTAAQAGSPLAIVEQVMQALEPDLIRSESFVTLFHAQLDGPHRTLTYVDAGHGHHAMIRASGSVDSLDTTGAPIGGIHCQPHFQAQIAFAPGDTFLVYSDGLWDARPELHFNLESLVQAITGLDSAQAIANKVSMLLGLQDLQHSLSDDVTLLILRCLD